MASRAERVESELVSLADWIERYFASRDLLPPPAIAAGVASARAALALPADAAGSAEAVRAACAAVPALEEARRRRLRWADEAHAQILAVPAQPAPEGAGEAVALPMRGDVGKPEATRDPIFLLRWRPRNRPIRGDRWTVEGVWFTREEAEEFARGHAYRWGSDKHGPCWQVYCVPADGTLAALLRARTAYNVAKVPPLYAHPAPRAEARAERAVGMVRRAYSIGYSAGCAGAPHSVRVDDLAALLKEVSHGQQG